MRKYLIKIFESFKRGANRLHNKHYKILTQETDQVTSLYCRLFGWQRSDGIINGYFALTSDRK